MNEDEEQGVRLEAARKRRRLLLRLSGWALAIAALAVVAWLAVA